MRSLFILGRDVRGQPRGGCAQAVFSNDEVRRNGDASSEIASPAPALRCSDWFGHWEQSITAAMNCAILPWRISAIFFAGIVRTQGFGSRGGAETRSNPALSAVSAPPREQWLGVRQCGVSFHAPNVAVSRAPASAGRIGWAFLSLQNAVPTASRSSRLIIGEYITLSILVDRGSS